MKRITVSLPEDLAARVEREARREHTSVSEVVRQSLTARLDPPPKSGKRAVPFAAMFDSGHTDTAERHDEILAEGFGRHIPFASLGRSGCATLSEDIEDILRDEWGGGSNT